MKELSYNDARYLIKDGDIIFQGRNSTVASRIIQFFTRAEHIHCGIAFWATISGERRLMMIEAFSWSPRRIVNLSLYQNEKLTVVKPLRLWAEYKDEALHQLGTVRYSWIGAAYVGLREFFIKYLRLPIFPHMDFPGEICSEFVARMMDRKEVNISPQRLFDQLTEEGCDVTMKINY
jgi:hypothetical protein